MRQLAAKFALAVLLSACGRCAAQDASVKAPGFSVRLEAHNGQTQFTVGDPVLVDLVFQSGPDGFVVDTGTAPYLSSSEIIYVTPGNGWVRTHQSIVGKPLNGNAEAKLGSEPVRVPVLLNRTIQFEQPGHYEVTVASERLRDAATGMRVRAIKDCDPCAATNAVGIDIAARDATEEAELVASLSSELEASKERKPGLEFTAEQEKMVQELQEQAQAQPDTADSSEESKKREQELVVKLLQLLAAGDADAEKKQADRRLAAQRLAYLEGDAAVRAKVHFIAAEKEYGEETPIALILVDGLPSSRNKQLQLDLLEAAWRDPGNLPTYQLHEALRAARELVRDGMVKRDEFAGTESERKEAVKRYQADLDTIIATLPQRTESNRAETIQILKKIAIPNPFNQGNGHP